MSAEEIRLIAEQKMIPSLVHFTRAENLETILKHGIHPISSFYRVGIMPEFNDTMRLDGHLTAVSTSIAFPNDKMFYKYRMENANVHWVVICIDKKIIWEKECAFCKHNAADNRIKCRDIEEIKGKDAFLEMFAEIEGHKQRDDQFLRTFDPTDVQAEILVFGVIEPRYIIEIAFDNFDVLNQYRSLVGSKRIVMYGKNKGLFSSRSNIRSLRAKK